ncbi:MAG: hypothetical protein K1X67_17060 [Fimbriimonadaceae bacterium]|nr:hypothetical protein [Fimbriimonadaceae bacterium]
MSETLRLRDNDFSRVLALADSIQIEGSARLNPGTYSIDGKGTQLSIAEVSTVNLSATVKLSPLPSEAGRIVLSPDYLDIEINASEPISVTTPSVPVTISVAGMTAQGVGDEQVASATLALRHGLAQTLLTQSLGDTPVDQESNIKQLVDDARVQMVAIKIRKEATLDLDEGNVQFVGDNNILRVANFSFNPLVGNLSGEFAAKLSVRTSACLRRAAPEVCVGAMSVEANGRYMENPTSRRIVIERATDGVGARINASDGVVEFSNRDTTIPVKRFDLDLSELIYEVPRQGSPQLEYRGVAGFDLGSGTTRTDIGPIRFAAAQAQGIAIERVGDGQLNLSMQSLTLTGVEVSGTTNDAPPLLAAETMRLSDMSLSSLGLRGKLAIDGLSAQLISGDTNIVLEAARGPSLTVNGSSEISLMVDVVQAPRTTISAVWDSFQVERRSGATTVLELDAKGVSVQADLSSLRPPVGQLNVGLAATVSGALPGVDTEFRLGNGIVKFDDKQYGLTISSSSIRMPKAQLFGFAQSLIPDTHAFEAAHISNDLAKSLTILFNPDNYKDVGRLHDWRAEPWISGLQSVEFAAEGSLLTVKGSIVGGFNVTANKEHIQVTTCEKRIHFKIGFKFSHRTELYPCVNTSYSRVKLDTVALKVDFAAGIEVGTNAPVPLANLALTLQPRCDANAMNVHGIQNDVEKLLTRRLCEKMNEKTIEIPIGKFAADKLSARQGLATVEGLTIDGTGEFITLNFGLSASHSREPG